MGQKSAIRVIAAVADTGPLLHLHEAGALHLLPCMAVVSIPMRVEQELRAQTASSRPPWLSSRVYQSAQGALEEILRQAG